MHWEQGRKLSSWYLSEYMVRIFLIGFILVMRNKISLKRAEKCVIFVTVGEQCTLELIYRLFGHIGRARDYLPMAMVIPCGRSQVLASAVAV